MMIRKINQRTSRRRSLLASAVAGVVVVIAGSPVQAGPPNPPATGFDLENSDQRAIEIADAVMEKMGGRRAWDQSRYIRWNFFGSRRHLWDKETGNVRIEGQSREGQVQLFLMNINTRTGRVFVDGVQIEDTEKRDKLLQAGYRMWVNDSYWLVMPYKLKDSGVTLKYKGQSAMEDGRPADVLELTFKDVGVTPGNKYEVYVGRETGLVEQWSFFSTRDDEAPRFTMPWSNWKRYGRIMLSSDRGPERKLTEIAVYDHVPESSLYSPEPVNYSRARTAAETQPDDPEGPTTRRESDSENR